MDRKLDEQLEIAELDRRWAKIQAGEETVQNADVVRWLETWGTPDFKPWPRRAPSPSP
jgi:hypothetical protein